MVEQIDRLSAARLADPGRRKTWLAALLAIIFPGLGQLYNGQALLSFAIILLIILAHVLVIIPDENGPIILLSISILIYLAAIVQAVLKARGMPGNYAAKPCNNWICYMVVLMVGIILTNLPGQLLYDFYSVEVECMSADYGKGDVLFVSRTALWLKWPGEEQVVLYQGVRGLRQISLGRIWAAGPNRIEIKGNAIFLDGNRILTAGMAPPEMRLEGQSEGEIVARDVAGELEIPKNSYLVLGDNSFGWADEACADIVPRQLILGQVKYLFYRAEDLEKPESGLKYLIYNLFLK